MGRPSFQFYHGDWRSNAKLRRCTDAERGIWIDVMCLLADADEFGILRWPLKDLAQAAGCKVALLNSLRSKDVLKGSDQKVESYVFTPRHAGKDGVPVALIPAQVGPLWYSSRMVRDEYLRTKRGEGTRFGDGPKPTPTRREGGSPERQPSQREGDGPSSPSSSPSSVNLKSKASAASGPKPPDPVKDEIWKTGRSLLESQDISRENAGKFLGKLVREYGQILVLEAVRDCDAARPAEAEPWLVARCQERRKKDNGNGKFNVGAARRKLERELAEEVVGAGVAQAPGSDLPAEVPKLLS